MNKLLKYSSVLYVLLVIAGYICRYFYYSLFGIDINIYLSTQDIFFSFLSIFTSNLLLIFAVAVFLLSSILIRHVIRLSENKSKIIKVCIYTILIISVIFAYVVIVEEEFFLPDNLAHRKLNIFRVYIPVLAMFTISVVILLLLEIDNLLVKKNQIIFLNKLPNKNSNLNFKEFRKNFGIITLYLLLIFAACTDELYTARTILSFSFDDNKRLETFRTADYDKNIFESVNVVLIGSTSNYLFTYDKKLKRTSVYNRSKLISNDIYLDYEVVDKIWKDSVERAKKKGDSLDKVIMSFFKRKLRFKGCLLWLTMGTIYKFT